MKKLLIILAIITLAACGRTQSEAQALYHDPQIIDQGTFDGCQVSYVDRGYEKVSFYIARCDNTTTTTRTWTETQGKTSVTRHSTVIQKGDK